MRTCPLAKPRSQPRSITRPSGVSLPTGFAMLPLLVQPLETTLGSTDRAAAGAALAPAPQWRVSSAACRVGTGAAGDGVASRSGVICASNC